ncbi:MAG: THUMP domain-containing protein, partial [Trueperaceae bacterium]
MTDRDAATEPARHAPPRRLDLLVRPTGEVTVKGARTRRVFLRTLRSNVRDACNRAGLRAEVRTLHNRLRVRVAIPSGEEVEPGAGPSPEAAMRRTTREVLQRVFGVGSFSFVEATCPPDLDAIVAMSVRHAATRVRGRRYAVRCRRAGRHGFRSTDVERAVGSALNDGATVDLTDPEVTVRLQVDDRRALLHGEPHAGPGGLPVGSGGRALVLASG